MISKEKIVEEINKNWILRHFDEQQRDVFIEILSDRKIKYCLETGFCTGASSSTVLAITKPEKMISVSLSHNNRSIADSLSSEYNFNLIEGDSSKILNSEFMEKEFPNGIDFFHVDGGHEGNVPLHDMVSSVNHLNDNFMIIVDDYKSKVCPSPDVDRAVDYFVEQTKFKNKFIATESGKGMAVITND